MYSILARFQAFAIFTWGEGGGAHVPEHSPTPSHPPGADEVARISKRIGGEAGQALGDRNASKREKSEAGEILRQLRDRKKSSRKSSGRKTTRRISRR